MTATETEPASRRVNIVFYSDRDARYYDAETGAEIGPEGIEDFGMDRGSAPLWRIEWDDGASELVEAAFIGTVKRARAKGVLFGGAPAYREAVTIDG